ncbi:RNA methyltransferase [Rhizobiaceae bacterium]|nr:RNA methyltransferase [Rhizobiaceae bacterium]
MARPRPPLDRSGGKSGSKSGAKPGDFRGGPRRGPERGPDRGPERAVRPDKPQRTERREHAAPFEKPRDADSNLEKVFGKHSVRAVFLARPHSVRRLVIAGQENYHENLLKLASENGVEHEFMDWPVFNRLGGFTEEDKHQGVMCFVEPKPQLGDRDLAEHLDKDGCVLVLDQISNPQNLATIIRGAAFFGASGVLVMKNRSAEVTPTVSRYAVGGTEFVDVFTITNIAQALESLKALGYWAYGLDERGDATMAQADFAPRSAFVIGAEGEGLRPKTRKFCDVLVRIPGGRAGVESINAAVAASVALAEFTRLQS